MKLKNIILTIVLLGILIPSSFAALSLDDVQFDPVIISAGDTVDVIVQYHDEFLDDNSPKENNPEYTFKIRIDTDDTLSSKYVTIFDEYGERDGNIVFEGKYYNDVFRVKVAYDAPAGDYRMKLVGQWYRNGAKVGGPQVIKFFMPVKKEGIVLDVSNIVTLPSEVRPGDNFVKLIANIENVGQKDAKSVEINLNMPEGISASYTNNNRIWAGRLNAGESKEVTFFVDLDDDLESGVKNLGYTFNYLDIDDNSYVETGDLPFLVKKRPDLEITKSEGVVKAGDSGILKIHVKNVGEESAEAVDVRLLLQNSQPFNLDIRSDYIGELQPGEEGVAIFKIDANSDASEKKHSIKVSIRSKGDSDEGDDNIYTYSRRAELVVKGKATNYLFYIGVGLLIIVSIIFVLKRKKK